MKFVQEEKFVKIDHRAMHNMINKFEKHVIIGKATKPRYFKGIDVSKLNVVWYSKVDRGNND